MSNLDFNTLGNVWIKIDKQDKEPVVEGIYRVKEAVIYVRHFMKPVEVRIAYFEGAPNPYSVKFLKCKWGGNSLDKLMRSAEEAIKHV